MQQLQTDLQNTFQGKLYPIIQQVVAEKGIEILFSQRDSGIVFANPALDLTADVIKRFDAAQAASAPPRRPPRPPPSRSSRVHNRLRGSQGRLPPGPASRRNLGWQAPVVYHPYIRLPDATPWPSISRR